MTICMLIEMKKVPSGLFAKIESNTREEATRDILAWLSDFYKRENKYLDTQHPKLYHPDKDGYYVLQSNDIVTEVKVAYMGNETKNDKGREVKSQRFGIYFDNPDRNPNTLDKTRFRDYFKSVVLEHPFRRVS